MDLEQFECGWSGQCVTEWHSCQDWAQIKCHAALFDWLKAFLYCRLACDCWETDSSKLGRPFFIIHVKVDRSDVCKTTFSAMNLLTRLCRCITHPSHHPSMNFHVFIQIRYVLIFISFLLNILSLNHRELHRNKINLIEPAAFNGLTKLERL